MKDDEIWKPVPGWEELYEVSNLGRVKSLPRKSKTRRLPVRGRLLKAQARGAGHLMVTLSRDRTTGGRSERIFIHKLVLTAFAGPQPDGLICRHLDGNPANNRWDNLLWGTHLENHLDAVAHGTFEHGDMHSQAKLTNKQVIELREAAAAGKNVSALAKCYGIAYRTANHIITGVKWKRIGGPIKPRRDKAYLDEASVREIRRLCAEGRSLNSLSRLFGVPPNSIKKIRDREYYRWVD